MSSTVGPTSPPSSVQSPIQIEQRRPDLSPRQKADDITRYIRERHNLSPGDFVVLRMTAEPEEPGPGVLSARQWNKRVCIRLSESLNIQESFARAGIPLDGITIKQARSEMKALIADSPFFGKWDHTIRPDIRTAIQHVKSTHHTLFDFLSAIAAPFHSKSTKTSQERRVVILISNLCNMAARNTSNYFTHLVGNNMAHHGLVKRGQEFLCSIGYAASYQTLLEDRNKIAEESKASDQCQSELWFYELTG